jgi:hypothetical protein
MTLAGLEPAIFGSSTNALSIRPQGRCLLATRLYEPVLGQLSAAFGKPAKTSSRGCRTDPYEMHQERRKKKYGFAARRQAPCETNTCCGEPRSPKTLNPFGLPGPLAL